MRARAVSGGRLDGQRMKLEVLTHDTGLPSDDASGTEHRAVKKLGPV